MYDVNVAAHVALEGLCIADAEACAAALSVRRAGGFNGSLSLCLSLSLCVSLCLSVSLCVSLSPLSCPRPLAPSAAPVALMAEAATLTLASW